MKLVDFIRIKKNVDQIIQIELSGNPQKQIIEYISLLENELIKKDVEVDHTIQFEVDQIKELPEYYIGKQYTRKDLENECVQFFYGS